MDVAAEDEGGRPGAVRDGGRGAYGDEGIHVGRELKERPVTNDVEPVPRGHDGREEEDLRERVLERVVHGTKDGGHGQAEHGAHGQVEERDRENRRHREFDPEDPRFAVLRGLMLIHSLRGLRREGLVAGLDDGVLYSGDARLPGVVRDDGLLRGEVHARGFHALDLPDGALDGGGAGGAAHPAHGDDDRLPLPFLGGGVSRLLHRGLDGTRGERSIVVFDEEGLGGEIHQGLGHARDLARRALRGGRAGRAGHAAYPESSFLHHARRSFVVVRGITRSAPRRRSGSSPSSSCKILPRTPSE